MLNYVKKKHLIMNKTKKKESRTWTWKSPKKQVKI